MKQSRRVLAMILAVCMAAGIVALPAGTQSVKAEVLTYGDFEYEVLDDKSVAVTGYTGADAEVTVPDVIDGKSVTEIGTSAFSECANMKKITLPDTLKSIREWAFWKCTGLTAISIPDGIISIKDATFSGCTGLTEITIPDSVVSIEREAFSYCKELKEIRIPDSMTSIEYSTFSGCIGLTEIIIPNSVTSIGNSAFSGCTGLTEITIPDSVMSIEYAAFQQCTGLRKVSIPDSVTYIGNSVFSGCTGLTEVSIPDSVTSLGEAAFRGCTGLVKIHISDSVNSIGTYTFLGCTGLTEISIPDSVASIGNSAFFGCTGLIEIRIPDRVTGIEKQAFYGCSSLKKLHIPNSVTRIEELAFSGCKSLEKVYYSGTEEQWQNIRIYAVDQKLLSDHIVYNSDSIEDSGKDYIYKELDDGTIEITKYNGSDAVVEIPTQIDEKKVTRIGDNSFEKNNKLEEASIPDSVTSIGDSAFRECDNLRRIKLPSGLVSIEKFAFSYCEKLEEINFPDGVTNIGDYSFCNCKSLTAITIPDGVTGIGYGTFYVCENLEEVSIPSGVTSIGVFAFSDCYALKEISIPPGVTSIGSDAFQNCESLTKFNIPVGVKKLERSTFYGCTNLSEIALPASITNIETQVFRDCINLDKIIIPSGVTVIKEMTFSGCKGLTEISLPDSIVEIEKSAFEQCSGMADVYFAGTKEKWGNIQILENNEDLLNAEIHFNNEGNITKDYKYTVLEDGTIEITEYTGSDSVLEIPSRLDERQVTRIGNIAFAGYGKLTEITVPDGVTEIGASAFENCKGLIQVTLPESVAKIGNAAFSDCGALEKITLPKKTVEIGHGIFKNCKKLKQVRIPEGVKELKQNSFRYCRSLEKVEIPEGVTLIESGAFASCNSLKSITIPISVVKISFGGFGAGIEPSFLEDIYYGGTKEQWEQIEVPGYDEGSVSEKLQLTATIHFKNDPIVLPEEPIQPEVRNPKEELENLKSNGTFHLDDFKHYLTEEQLGIMEDYLYTWLAQVNYAYQYSGSSTVKELIMKKAGIDPDGDFSSGMEQAITHISVNTKYGTKTFEITMGLGQPDSSGNLYPGYSVMHYEILEKSGVPSDVPVSGQIVRDYYTDMGAFVESVKRASEDSLHNTYQWQQLEDEMTAGVLIDKTAAEIVGNKNGSFSDGTFTIYAQPLFAYSKIVKISCPVDVHVYGMDGAEAGSIVDNKPSGGNQHVWLDVDGDTKTVYLAGDDYYLNLRGTGTGTMKYEVEEIANEEVRRNVQFLELQLKNDMLYEGYVFRPLNIDRDLYELRAVEKNGSGGEVFRADEDSYQPSFKKVQGLSLSQKNTTLESNRTVQLSASHYPMDASNPNLRWATDNESVARVDKNGLVTAVGSGRATVTVSTKDGSFLKQFCVIDVAQRDDGENGGNGNGSGSGSGDNNGNGSGGNGDSSSSNGGGSGNNSNGGNSSGNNSSTGGNSSSGGNSSGSSGSSSGNSSGSNTAAGQDKPPVVVSLHYVLQFHANGGTNLSRRTMTLLADDSPGIMPKVQRKDYTFDGWYTKQEGGTRIAGDEPLKEAATLYARWTKAQAPAKVSALSLKSKKKGQLQASFQKVKGAAGYQVSYSGSKKFTSEKTKEAGAAVKTKTVTGLKAGKKYYVRVRAYCLDSAGNRIYGAYSAVKSVKTKM